MKKYINLATALIASLKPKSKTPIIDTYGESTLNQDEQQALMEWLFASLMGVGYFSKAHLIWDDGKEREREIFTALMRNEPIFLYRQGVRPTPTVEGYGWRLIGEHPSLRVYELQVEVEGD
ncbi:hypothetical protein QUB75_04535 [Microcoleus sp. K1-B6]|uniref:hypothetical protein n=1 Tax=unclassified Microcoleus TaxID=2642155 RepID=UPI002FD30E0A